MKNKWKWLVIIAIAVYLIKNAVHYAIIIIENNDFNQLFGFFLGLFTIGYLYYSLAKMWLNDGF